MNRLCLFEYLRLLTLIDRPCVVSIFLHGDTRPSDCLLLPSTLHIGQCFESRSPLSGTIA